MMCWAADAQRDKSYWNEEKVILLCLKLIAFFLFRRGSGWNPTRHVSRRQEPRHRRRVQPLLWGPPGLQTILPRNSGELH